MLFLTPRYIQQGRQFAKDARKLLAYKRDLWSGATIADFERGIEALETAVKERDKAKVEDAAAKLDAQCTANLPLVTDAAWRENVEVFLVAIVVALGVRTYFLQPFTIPTASMFPTLNGIIGHPTPGPPPNMFTQLWQTAWYGRTWIDVTAKDDERIEEVTETSRFLFCTYTRVKTDKNEYLIHIPKATAFEAFAVRPDRRLTGGEPIARGYHDTGDHVFVDKFTFNFRTPKREEVFVFNTLGIPTIDNRSKPDAVSQFYIKRLVGLPNDQLRIDPPCLYVNGQKAAGDSFERVMAGRGEYRGYGLGFPSFLRPIMRAPTEIYPVPPKSYFALGDNSYHSSDSRDWGPVPQQNIMGRGVFVYWPFSPHFGPIKGGQGASEVDQNRQKR